MRRCVMCTLSFHRHLKLKQISDTDAWQCHAECHVSLINPALWLVPGHSLRPLIGWCHIIRCSVITGTGTTVTRGLSSGSLMPTINNVPSSLLPAHQPAETSTHCVLGRRYVATEFIILILVWSELCSSLPDMPTWPNMHCVFSKTNF